MVVVCAVVLFKRRQFALATYTLLSVVLTLSSTLLQSQARYAMVVFPVYLVLGVAGRNDKVDQVLRLIFIVLLTFLTALFARHVTLALS
jgi:anaerobic C4-dicarboxylate transporter